jgi:tRNA(Ile)-lysidine synthase TilS/MesJ
VPEVTAPAGASSGSSSHTLLYVLAGIIVALGIALIAVSVRTRSTA